MRPRSDRASSSAPRTANACKSTASTSGPLLPGGGPPTGTNAFTTGRRVRHDADVRRSALRRGHRASGWLWAYPDAGERAQGLPGVRCPAAEPEGRRERLPTSTARPSVSRSVSYVACVKQNGYDLPAPNLSGNGPIFDESKVNRDDPKFQSASQKCQQLLQPPAQGTSTTAQ